MLATFAHAQDSQFHFDPNGNLFVQTSATISPPQILGQPQNRIVGPDEAATFSVVAADTRLLAYQWGFNGTNISGATNDAVVLQNVSTNSEGEYRVVLTNPSGSVTSAPALLMIDSDADGIQDSWELAFFGNLTNSATTDFDRDGSSNLQEFLNATDPANSNSIRFRLTVLVDGGSVTLNPQPSTLNQFSYTNGQSVTLTATAFPGGEPFHAWVGDIVTRSNPVTLVMTNNKTIHARFTPIDFIWTNLAGGDWNFATNWTPNLVPGSNDSVFITGNPVTLNTLADCADFSFGESGVGASLTGSGTLTIRGNFLWTQGTMTGSGRTVIETGGTLDVVNPAGKGASLATRTLENGGTVFWTGGGAFSMNSGAVITNRAGALFHVQNAASLVGAGRFDNAGTFRKSVDSGTTTISSGISFNNSGAMEIQTGTLSLNGGGTNSGGFDVTAGATLAFSVGTVALNPGAEFNGAGLYKINNGTLTANTDVAVQNLDLLNGTMSVTGTVTIATQMNWTGGTMNGSGRTVIAPSATLNVNNTLPGSPTLTTRTLENGGAVFFTGAGILAVIGNAVITNRPGAVFNFENENVNGLGGGIANGRFDNAGTFRKSAGTGTGTVFGALSFNNSGAVEIQTGALSLLGGGTHSGSFDLPGGTALTLSGTHTATASSAISGAGQFNISGGTANLAGLVNVSGGNTFSGGTANLTGNYICSNNTLTISGGTANFNGSGMVSPAVVNLSSGTLGGSNLVTVLNQMNWTGGTMSGSGRTIIPAGVTLNAAIPSSATLTTRALENGGTVLWTGAGFIGVTGSAVITNRVGALFHVQNAAILGGGIANGRFLNAGTFRKSNSAGTTTISSGLSITNSGLVDIRSGILAANGGYNSTSNALLNCALGGTTAGMGFGQLQVAGTVTLNGALSLDLLPGFSPAMNDTFTVVTAGTRSGAFTAFSYPSNRVTMALSNTANSVVVNVSEVLVVPQPVLLTPELSGTDVRLTWTAISNITYRLEFETDPGFTNWIGLPGDILSLSNSASKLDALTSSNRFYRVRMIP